ncbi:NUDIX hydrolase [Fodinibius salsisoli]|uniref:GDP-mannose pyrophosphatase n=1 Tax=Fodinibius salsisoli TaxID=2820877 RepID=A0ABT3PLP4_9BACT|nr:NUDIX hydrolase [Fodinibius salsisoli]MCW9706879.1 NUDIX hydrolase [Fodinibius salsisoli]
MSQKTFPFTIEPWLVTDENKEYKTPIFNLLRRNMRLEAEGESNEAAFYVLEAPQWVNVLPITEEEEVVLVEQYRYGIEQPTLEIPGGMVDPGESAREAAERELLEETGYQGNRWQGLGKVSANPAIMTNYAHLFLAEGCSYEQAISPDEHERFHIHKLPMEAFLGHVADGTIHHSIVVAAVAKYLLIKN